MRTFLESSCFPLLSIISENNMHGHTFFQQVSHFVYFRWNVAYPVLKAKPGSVHDKIILEVKEVDERL